MHQNYLVKIEMIFLTTSSILRFLQSNIAAGYEYIQFLIPDHPVGPDLPEIIHIDSDTIVTEVQIKILPPVSLYLYDYM